MTIPTIDIQHLPYDILVSIFEHLDRKTLLAACLACSQLNELASSPLYYEVSFLASISWYWRQSEEDLESVKAFSL